MSITDAITQLQAINAAISGVATAPARPPDTLNDSALPAVIVIPGPAAWNEHAIGLRRQDRTYIMRFFVLPVGQGVGFKDGFARCVSLLHTVGNTYLANIDLDGTVDHCSNWRDGGIRGDMVYENPEQTYHGFEFSLTVTEKTST